MKKLCVIPIFIASLLATQAVAGNLTLVGNLTVATNLTAHSITLGGATQTNWSFLPLQGYKYVIVAEGTTDTQRGGNLKAAYTTATGLSPNSSNRVAVIVPPGSYNLGTTGLTMNTSYVDLIGLVPAQMTSKQVFTDASGRQRPKTVANVQCSVRIYSSASAGTLVQSVDYVRIESAIFTNTGSGVAYGPSVSSANAVLRHVSMSSMSDVNYAGQYVDCVSGDNAFGGFGDATGTFVDCIGGIASFAATDANASGTFISCTGGLGSFGGQGGNASGTFIECVGGGNSFGSQDAFGDGAANGTFKSCVAGDESFGGNAQAVGTFIDCVAGDYSFGGSDPYNYGSLLTAGTFIDCVGGASSFGGGASLDNAAKLQRCKGSSGSFGAYNEASQDFNYNVGGTNTFLMLPQLPTSTNGLPRGTVYNSSGTLKIMP